MQIFKSTTKRIGNRWETGLLWRTHDVALPKSYAMAKQRLVSIEKQMKKDENFANLQKEKIKEYVSKGYASKLEPNKVSVRPQITLLILGITRNGAQTAVFNTF